MLAKAWDFAIACSDVVVRLQDLGLHRIAPPRRAPQGHSRAAKVPPARQGQRQSDAGKGFEFKGDPVFDNDKIGIAVRKNDALREKLNAALKEIVADGTYKQINDKYFPFSIL